jgi:hypothetical protein
MKRVGAGRFAVNARFDDHPGDARRSGHSTSYPPNRCWRFLVLSIAGTGVGWLGSTKATVRVGDTAHDSFNQLIDVFPT